MADGKSAFSADEISEASAELVRIVHSQLPKEVQAEGVAAEDWRLVGPCMVAKAAGTLQAMLDLLPARRTVDATILLRSLYEGTLAFAWIALDPPANLPRWLKRSVIQAIKGDDDWARVGIGVLDKENRDYGEAKANDQSVPVAPDAATMADQVDRQWGHAYPRIAQLTGEPADVVSFRGMYRHVYRMGSGESHYELRTLRPFYTTDALGGVLVHREKPDQWALYPWLFGTHVLGLGLLIGSTQFGWPSSDDVLVALAKASIVILD
jgi:hypothetical protein